MAVPKYVVFMVFKTHNQDNVNMLMFIFAWFNCFIAGVTSVASRKPGTNCLNDELCESLVYICYNFLFACAHLRCLYLEKICNLLQTKVLKIVPL